MSLIIAEEELLAFLAHERYDAKIKIIDFNGFYFTRSNETGDLCERNSKSISVITNGSFELVQPITMAMKLKSRGVLC